ncbi:hypothetical protein TNCT_604811 [Trichonephila clavata]|uniref:Uncharacterized protein n=1 Tax=Trichonephila clavata TaxID=2740835 RepID=A0A8X6KHJ6_TRICU|nr:hypothetical protein TNCT_604811 [Trichonephila clavata]
MSVGCSGNENGFSVEENTFVPFSSVRYVIHKENIPLTLTQNGEASDQRKGNSIDDITREEREKLKFSCFDSSAGAIGSEGCVHFKVWFKGRVFLE